MLITRHTSHLRVAMRTHGSEDQLRNDRHPLIDRGRGEQAIHQRQTAPARWRERRLTVFAERPTVTADHRRPDPAAHRCVRPHRIPQRRDVVPAQERVPFTVRGVEEVVGDGGAARLRCRVQAYEVHCLTAADSNEKQRRIPDADDVRSMKLLSHAPQYAGDPRLAHGSRGPSARRTR